jgi:hypothetical protein
MNVLEREKPYSRHYERHQMCDWCGAFTRGRIFDGSTKVVCGACHEIIAEVLEPKQ